MFSAGRITRRGLAMSLLFRFCSVVLLGNVLGEGHRLFAGYITEDPVLADKPIPEYVALVNEYEAQVDSYYERRRLSGNSLREFDKETPHPREIYPARFLTLAEQKPGSNLAETSLAWVVNHASPEKSACEYTRAARILIREHIKSPRLLGCATELTLGGRSGPAMGANEEFLSALTEGSPHREVRAAAKLALAEGLYYQAGLVEAFQRSAADRLREFEELSSKDFVAAMRKQDAVRLKGRAVKLFEKLAVDGAALTLPVPGREGTVGEIANQYLFTMKNIVEGKRAPELEGVNLQGEPVRLADLRGRLVVVKTWATWCVPCRRDFDFLRDMEDAYRDKPFLLVVVSVDDELQELRETVRAENVPGASWLGGASAKNWYNNGISHRFVIDVEGVIRGIDVTDEELVRLVGELVR